jgi:hypothetical protein
VGDRATVRGSGSANRFRPNRLARPISEGAKAGLHSSRVAVIRVSDVSHRDRFQLGEGGAKDRLRCAISGEGDG